MTRDELTRAVAEDYFQDISRIQNTEPNPTAGKEMYHSVTVTELEKFLSSEPIEKHLTRTDSAVVLAEAILARFRVMELPPQEQRS